MQWKSETYIHVLDTNESAVLFWAFILWATLHSNFSFTWYCISDHIIKFLQFLLLLSMFRNPLLVMVIALKMIYWHCRIIHLLKNVIFVETSQLKCHRPIFVNSNCICKQLDVTMPVNVIMRASYCRASIFTSEIYFLKNCGSYQSLFQTLCHPYYKTL